MEISPNVLYSLVQGGVYLGYFTLAFVYFIIISFVKQLQVNKYERFLTDKKLQQVFADWKVQDKKRKKRIVI